MKLFLKCNEATHYCDKTQYKEVDFWNKISLNVHLIMCTVCRNYAKKNGKLTHALKSANIKTLCSKDKDRLKTWFSEEIKTSSKL